MWIDFLIRKITYDQKTIKLATPSDYLKEYPVNQLSVPSISTWGYKGYNEVWLEGSNDWIYRHLYAAGERMKELAEKFSDCIEKGVNDLAMRALNQAARELLLAQASDWPFIMKTGTMVEYAQKRVKLHINRFTHIYKDMLSGSVDKEWLEVVESRDNIFSDMDCARYYSSRLRLHV